ncbi:alpha/beta hydrolase [Oceanicola sp. S124]|uniref:alpha/beta hydrolase n=1 Tax=Oceanicola sp. S124 TaxID=1042378 RepID=UPI0002558D37|nr:alpha/beta hydrolase [Oceanicola sp. S124]
MIDPQLQGCLDEWAAGWEALPPGATPAQRRTRFEVMSHAMRGPMPEDVDARTEHWIETEAGPVRVRVFRHCSGGVQPCLIYMHGGGWVQGSPETHWDITASLAAMNRQTVISVDYDLAPEVPFPAAIDQCTAVARWSHANAALLGIDPGRIAVGGDSAGANLAAVMALDLRGSEVALTGQLLAYPPCDFDRSRPSYTENGAGPMIRLDARVEMAYCPDPDLLSSPRCAPLMADSLAGLPPAFVAVAEHDPLRDSGRAYAERLQAEGVAVTLEAGQGLTHGYLRFIGRCAACDRALSAMAAWLDGINRGPAAR